MRENAIDGGTSVCATQTLNGVSILSNFPVQIQTSKPRLIYYRDHYYSGLIPICNPDT